MSRAARPLSDSGARAIFWLATFTVGITALHILIVGTIDGPWIFPDELGWERTAQSLGTSGQLALFGKEGLSYSPLYPLALAPLFALHLSAPAAYYWAKVVNCILLSLATVPIYKIGRTVLSPGRAAVAAGISLAAPLMFYSSLEVSESLDYPLFLCAVWAMIEALRSPSIRKDILFLAFALVASAARLQFLALLPAAFCALLAQGLIEARTPGRRWRAALQEARTHPALTIAAVACTLVALAAAAGSSVVAVAGRNAQLRKIPAPTPWRIGELMVEHLAELDLALAVIPFAGALFAGYLWSRRRSPRAVNAFATVGLSVTFFTVLTTALAAYAVTHVPVLPGSREAPRIHERYEIYLVPLFVIAAVATTAVPRSGRLLRIGTGVALIVGLLPALIPYGRVVNNSIVADTFGLELFARVTRHGVYEPVHHAALIAVILAFVLALIYALLRPRLGFLTLIVLIGFSWMSGLARVDMANAANGATGATLTTRNWVDKASPKGTVAFVESPRTPELVVAETAFNNLSISRLYYRCRPDFTSDFNEEQVALGEGGVLLEAGLPVRAAYVIADARGGIEGAVVARDRRSGLVLVRVPDGVVRITAVRRGDWSCP